MIDKKVFHGFLQEVKGVEKQKRKYEKAARIARGRGSLVSQETVETLLYIVVCTVCGMMVFVGFVLLCQI